MSCIFDLFSAEVVDFAKPSGNHSTHPKLFHWVKTYFQNGKQHKSSPLAVNSGELSVQQGSSQTNSVISCASKCCDKVDVDCLKDIDSKVPVTKKRKLEDDKSKTWLLFCIKTYLIYQNYNFTNSQLIHESTMTESIWYLHIILYIGTVASSYDFSPYICTRL